MLSLANTTHIKHCICFSLYVRTKYNGTWGDFPALLRHSWRMTDVNWLWFAVTSALINAGSRSPRQTSTSAELLTVPLPLSRFPWEVVWQWTWIPSGERCKRRIGLQGERQSRDETARGPVNNAQATRGFGFPRRDRPVCIRPARRAKRTHLISQGGKG